jgi:hypothetical protein
VFPGFDTDSENLPLRDLVFAAEVRAGKAILLFFPKLLLVKKATHGSIFDGKRLFLFMIE